MSQDDQSDLDRSDLDRPDPSDPPEKVPFFQQLMDNPFLLLFLGVVVPTVFYVIWGVMEIIQIPIAP